MQISVLGLVGYHKLLFIVFQISKEHSIIIDLEKQCNVKRSDEGAGQNGDG